MSAPADADPDPFAEIAQVIAGRGRLPPPYLASNLYRAAELVRAFHESERGAPHRAVMKKRLAAAATAAQQLAAELADPAFAAFLDHAEQESLRPDLDYAALLADISRRASNANDAIPAGGGRAPALPQHRSGSPVYLSPRDLTAFIIVEAWKLCSGTKPKVRDGAAAEAASMLWRAVTGSGATGWSHTFTKLEELRAQGDPRSALLGDIRAALRSPLT